MVSEGKNSEEGLFALEVTVPLLFGWDKHGQLFQYMFQSALASRLIRHKQENPSSLVYLKIEFEKENMEHRNAKPLV